MRNQIMTVGDSPAVRDIIDNSSGKIVVTNSGRSESVKLHLVSANDVAHADIQSGMGGESAAQTVTSKENSVITVLVPKTLEFVKEIASKEISVFHIEIISSNSIIDGVEIIGGSTRLKCFFSELSDSLSATESNDDSSGAFVDKERIRNGFSAPESIDVLTDKSVASEVVTSVTALHVIKISGLTVGGSGSSEEITGKAFIVSLNGNKSQNDEKKDGGEFGRHGGEINN